MVEVLSAAVPDDSEEVLLFSSLLPEFDISVCLGTKLPRIGTPVSSAEYEVSGAHRQAVHAGLLEGGVRVN